VRARRESVDRARGLQAGWGPPETLHLRVRTHAARAPLPDKLTELSYKAEDGSEYFGVFKGPGGKFFSNVYNSANGFLYPACTVGASSPEAAALEYDVVAKRMAFSDKELNFPPPGIQRRLVPVATGLLRPPPPPPHVLMLSLLKTPATNGTLSNAQGAPSETKAAPPPGTQAPVVVGNKRPRAEETHTAVVAPPPPPPPVAAPQPPVVEVEVDEPAAKVHRTDKVDVHETHVNGDAWRAAGTPSPPRVPCPAEEEAAAPAAPAAVVERDAEHEAAAAAVVEYTSVEAFLRDVDPPLCDVDAAIAAAQRCGYSCRHFQLMRETLITDSVEACLRRDIFRQLHESLELTKAADQLALEMSLAKATFVE